MSLSVLPGPVTISVVLEGFVAVQQAVTVPASGLEVTVHLVPTPRVDEEVVVIATTRTGRRVEDQPTRVEVTVRPRCPNRPGHAGVSSRERPRRLAGARGSR